MKFIAPFLALVAAALAQNNAINIPAGGLQVTAGQPFTITWSDPSSSTVTIKLQQGSGVTPSTGITLLTGIPASDKTATFTVLADEVNNSQYNIEIIDDSDPSNYNFTPGFVVAGATCVGTCDGASATTTGSASTTGTASSTTTGSSASSSASASSASVSSSSASASSSLTSSLSSSASSASASGSSASASGSSASASGSSASSTSGSAATSAPSSEAVAVKAQAGLVMALVAAFAAF